MKNKHRAIPIIAGPTASGKTEVAVNLARQINGEIINCDSMQVYQKLSIGTAKPTAQELCGVPCHLIDHITPNEQYNLGRFVEEANQCIYAIRGRGNQPVICGGTGMYIRGLVYGILQQEIAPTNIRDELSNRLQHEGLASLFKELEHVDLASAIRYGPNDRQRILRALEVYHNTGIPLSQQHTQNPGQPLISSRIYVLQRDRADLYNRIDNRVDQMISTGLLDEIRNYLAAGWSRDNPAFRALGYRELTAALESSTGLSEAVSEMKKKSRNYAKRQETWFRHMPGTIKINFHNKTTEELTREILADWENCNR